MQSFDLVVIGTGSAGKVVAEKARQAGKTVAIVDKLPFGGTCSQRGCDPKKVLVGAAEIVARSAQMQGKGITETATIDWTALMAFKKTFTDTIPENTEIKFAKQGITAFHGAATFTGPNTLTVGNEELVAPHIVLATGQRPKHLDIPGEKLMIDSTGFLDLEQLPDTIVLVGGGYIAFEFAHIAARAGAKVTIIHRGKRPLEGFDADLVKVLVKVTESLGIKVLLEAAVKAVEGETGDLTVQYEHHGELKSVPTKLVVHAAGRVADVAELALEKAGVDVSEKGVVVNEYLQSVSSSAIYACGDVADKGKPLTPLASYEGSIVISNILNGNQKTFANDPVPTTVFSLPPLASIGLTEEEANEKKLNPKVIFQETTDWYNSRRINEPSTGFKVLIDSKTDQIIGAHVLGTGSDELINVFTLAMKHHITAKALSDTLFAYPTHASDVSSMLDG